MGHALNVDPVVLPFPWRDFRFYGPLTPFGHEAYRPVLWLLAQGRGGHYEQSEECFHVRTFFPPTFDRFFGPALREQGLQVAEFDF